MISNSKLRALIQASRNLGEPSADLIKAVQKIAHGMLASDPALCQPCDVPIAVNNSLLKFIAVWKKINPRGNIFSYISSIARNEARMLRRSNIAKNKIFDHDSDVCSDKFSGFPSPQSQTRSLRAARC